MGRSWVEWEELVVESRNVCGFAVRATDSLTKYPVRPALVEQDERGEDQRNDGHHFEGVGV